MTPDRVSEPVDGVVELRGDEILARLRWSKIPLNQGAILALLRAVPEGEGAKPILFSVTGYTPGAVAIAETLGVALYSVDGFGAMTAHSPLAYHLMPVDAPPAPFAPKIEEAAVPTMRFTKSDPDDWLDCPNCGATHHHRANFCASCGSTLHPEPEPEPVAPRGRPVPPPDPGGPVLRCRTCGSNDIELVRPT